MFLRRHPVVKSSIKSQGFGVCLKVTSQKLLETGRTRLWTSSCIWVSVVEYGVYFLQTGWTVIVLFLFQNKIILDPLTFSEARFRPSLEERLESIISGAALMADSSCTRDDRRERIVAECNSVRQALQDLLSEYMNNVSLISSHTCSKFTRTQLLPQLSVQETVYVPVTHEKTRRLF